MAAPDLCDAIGNINRGVVVDERRVAGAESGEVAAIHTAATSENHIGDIVPLHSTGVQERQVHAGTRTGVSIGGLVDQDAVIGDTHVEFISQRRAQYVAVANSPAIS